MKVTSPYQSTNAKIPPPAQEHGADNGDDEVGDQEGDHRPLGLDEGEFWFDKGLLSSPKKTKKTKNREAGQKLQ